MRYCYAAAVGLTMLLMGIASGADLGTVAAPSGPEIVFTRQAGAVLRREFAVQVQTGSNRFVFDFGRYEIDPAGLTLRVLSPTEDVQVSSREISAKQPGQAVFLLEAKRPGQARLRLCYPLKGLETEVAYTALLLPRQQTLTLEAQVTLRNGSKQALPHVQVVLGSGHRLTAELDQGESVQQTLFRQDNVPYQSAYLYDNARFKDSVRALVRLQRDGTGEFDRLPLPAGKLRAFVVSGSSPTFIGESALRYTPAHEKLEMDLGGVPDLTVVRTRLRADQSNARTDVYRKLVLFDLEEEWELQLENHRLNSATLLLDEHLPGEWQMQKVSGPFEKLEAGTIEFAVKLAPGEKTKLTYVVKRLNVEP